MLLYWFDRESYTVIDTHVPNIILDGNSEISAHVWSDAGFFDENISLDRD